MRVKEAQKKIERLENTMTDLEQLMLYLHRPENREWAELLTEEAGLSDCMSAVLDAAFEAVQEQKRTLERRVAMAEI